MKSILIQFKILRKFFGGKYYLLNGFSFNFWSVKEFIYLNIVFPKRTIKTEEYYKSNKNRFRLVEVKYNGTPSEYEFHYKLIGNYFNVWNHSYKPFKTLEIAKEEMLTAIMMDNERYKTEIKKRVIINQ